MSSFDYFRQQQEENSAQNTSARVPSRPQGWGVTLKHNAQNGDTSLSLNLRSRSDVDQDYVNVPVDSYEFVVMTAMQMGTANAESLGYTRVSSNVTNSGYFDIAGFTEDRTRKDLGLFNQQMLYQEHKYWSQPRLFGILRGLNGQAPASVPQIAQYFGTGAIPVVMDLTFDKQAQLMKVIGVPRYDLKALVGKSIKVTKSQTAGQVKRHGRQYYQPDFQVTTLTADQEAKMNDYAKDVVDQLIAYNKRINTQDDLYAYIFESGLKGTAASQLLDQLSDANITTKEGATEFIQQHGGWTAYTGVQPASPSVTPSVAPTTTPQPQVAPQAAPQVTLQPQPAPAPQPAPQQTEDNDSPMQSLGDSGDTALPF